jgi:histidyl-tRNA synthetase
VTKFEAPRGTHDILPAEWPAWRRVVETAEELAELYDYRRIQTPGFEDTEVFARTSGAGSDVVQKEMYTFTDRADRSLTLRPEGTAPIARAYLEHGLHKEAQPQKLYTIAPMYRYGAPQRGRFREHWQLSVEALGSDDPAIDAELIQLYDELLHRLGVTGYELQLNSIGDRNCRPEYLARLEAWLDEHDAALDDEARQKRATSPLRVFDVKNERVLEALAGAPKIGESLCEPCREHFGAVRRYLDALGVRYELVPTLVRGLDYYTRTTFEFVDEAIGAQSSITGGGRYDYLVEELGGPPTPGIGFGAGIERLLLSMGADEAPPDEPELDVFLAAEPDAPRERVVALLLELRRAGLSADTDYAGRSLKGQLTHARRLGARATAIVGAERAAVRRPGETDVEVALDELVATLAGR